MKEEIGISQKDRSLKQLRLAARITATVWTLFCLYMFVGYMMEDIQRNKGVLTSSTDWLAVATVVSLFIGFIGLIIAYWREGIGALISLIGFLLGALFLIIDPKLTFSFIYFIILLPTILYFIYWNEKRKIVHPIV